MSYMADLLRVCGHIRRRREELQITQSEMAEHLGISLATLKRIEAGEIEPRADTLFRYADRVGVRITGAVITGEAG
jgi:transcriptional regulator with XRE-family HTH domain